MIDLSEDGCCLARGQDESSSIGHIQKDFSPPTVNNGTVTGRKWEPATAKLR